MSAAADPTVAEALAALRAQAREVAALAEEALGRLLCDGPVEELDRHRLQVFLWYELPAGDAEQGRTVREAAAVALGRVLVLAGFPRYAEICTSSSTMEVLGAYERSREAGFAAARRAQQRSGITPPDLPELEWGDVVESRELEAFLSTARSLELAVAVGDVRPGYRGWRRAQAQAARAHLHRSRPELGGKTLLESVIDERLDAWLGKRGDTSRQIVLPVAGLVRERRDPAPEVLAALEPLRWLLRAADGTQVGPDGELSLDLALRAGRRFGWLRRGDGGHGAVPRLRNLWNVVEDMGAGRRRAHRASVGRKGVRLAGDPEALWRACARALCPGDGLAAAAAELVLALLLTRGALGPDALVEAISEALADDGWRDRQSREVPDHRTISRLVRMVLVRLHTLAMLAGTDLELTEAGRATALEALRQRACGPRAR